MSALRMFLVKKQITSNIKLDMLFSGLYLGYKRKIFFHNVMTKIHLSLFNVAEFLDFGLETLFSGPKTESDETILLDPPDKELENLSGEETEEYLEQILDISNNNITHVQHALVSSSSYVDSPPSSPDSMMVHPGSHYNSYSPFDPVSSSCVHSEPPIICKTEAPWSPTVPSPASPDSSSHFCYPYPWQQNIKYDDFAEEKHSNYLSHSPDSSRCEYPTQSIVPCHECEPTIDDKEDNVKYEEWTIFQHVGPDGRCECKEKKNLSKCLAQKCKSLDKGIFDCIIYREMCLVVNCR